jgi:branched-chain amino acid transport system permease protein
MDWINVTIQGILLGGLYALFAVGLSLVFGVMRIVNLAHGDFGILAAFIALFFVQWLHVGLLWSSFITIVLMFGIGYVLQRGLLNYTLGTDDTRPILVTFGLSVIIQNALLLTFTADTQGLKAGSFTTRSITISDQLAIGWYPLFVFILAIVAISALQMFLARTQYGRGFRATSDDREAAELMGINNRHVYGLAMAIALFIVGIAGILLGIKTTFDPTQGQFNLLFAFEAVIMGGMGSLWGTLAGGILLGVAQTLGNQAFGSGWAILCGHLVFLLVLLVRPQGIFPKTVTA